MKIISETYLRDFEYWGGARATANHIEEECGTEGWILLDAILTDMYPDGIDETELNDLLWFDAETVYEWLGIGDKEEDDDEDEDDEEEEETEPTNDYVINVGDSWDDLTPQQTFSTEQAAISAAKALHDKCVEVVYSPCNDVDTNELIWRN